MKEQSYAMPNPDGTLRFYKYNDPIELESEVERLIACIVYFKHLAHRGANNEDLADFHAIHYHAENCLRPCNSIVQDTEYPKGSMRETGLWPDGMEEHNPRHKQPTTHETP